MIWPFGKVTSLPHLGIDIGTETIKVVKIQTYRPTRFFSSQKKKGKLINYGSLSGASRSLLDNQGRILLESEVVKSLRSLLARLNEEGGEAVMGIPVFATFVDEITLPPMPGEEIEKAVEFEARSHVPVPISDVKLGWEIIDDASSKATQVKENLSEEKERRVLLVAVPNDVVFRYQSMASQLGLTLKGLELETFAIMRALDLPKDEADILLDIGARNTSIALVKNGFLRLAHHIEASGEELNHTIAQGMGVSITRAQDFKMKEGLNAAKENPELGSLMYPVIDKIIDEVKRTLDASPYGREVKRIILVGGGAALKGLKEYMSRNLSLSIDMPNPWATIEYPPPLEGVLKERALSFAVAIGLALY